jgi:hypothetical protein
MRDAVAELSVQSAKNASNSVVAPGDKSLPLNSVFGSFGEALHAWHSSGGYEADKKIPGETMIAAFCGALQIPYGSLNTLYQMRSYEYFEDTDWIFDWMRNQGFVEHTKEVFMFIDEGNRPTARLCVLCVGDKNFYIMFMGDERIGLALREEIGKHICTDVAARDRPVYLEVTLEKMPSGERVPSINQHEVQNVRETMDEFYPYLNGGASSLLQDFMESDEGALILMGPPGTGKSSAISAAIKSMNLIPIYVKSTEVIEHPDFVSFVMAQSDLRMKMAQEGETGRSTLYKQKLADHPSRDLGRPFTKIDWDRRIPLIVIEDAGALIAPIKEGNKLMANLLNELDGIGSALSRKVIFTTNLTSTKNIDEALLRPGRCYDAVTFHLLTPEQAVKARKAAGLPDFEVMPTKDIPLAEAVRKPRRKISIERAKNRIGF